MTADRREVGGVDDERVILFIFLSLSPLLTDAFPHSHSVPVYLFLPMSAASSLRLRRTILSIRHSPLHSSLFCFCNSFPFPKPHPLPLPSLSCIHIRPSFFISIPPLSCDSFIRSFSLPEGRAVWQMHTGGRLLALPPEYEVQKLPWAL